MADGQIGAVDAAQRRWTALGLPIAVVYKYFDDQATYLAVIVTYYALFAIFPLLLLATSILGFVLQGHPDLQQRVLESALSQFPVIGDRFRQPEGMTGSTTAAVVGGIAAVYGGMGLGTAVQNATNIAWAIPRNSRPNPFLLRVRGLFIVAFGGVAILGLTTASVLVSNTSVVAMLESSPLRLLARVASVLVVGGVLVVLMRLAAFRPDRQRTTVPGALLTALLWHLIQSLGAVYVTRVIVGADALNQTFGLVLGLMAAIFLVAISGMLGVELNVVLAKRLWPRALLTPFTDSVVLTEADQRAYSDYAQAQRHKGFEEVRVTFGDRDRGREDPDPQDG